MASQYDTETKAQARAQLMLGKPATHVAQEMGIPERTVNDWAQRMRQIAAKEGDQIITDEDYRLAVRTGELLHDALDQMVERDDLYKYLVPLNIIRGTAIDKILKRQEPKYAAVQTGDITINFISQAPPDIIEGEKV